MTDANHSAAPDTQAPPPVQTIAATPEANPDPEATMIARKEAAKPVKPATPPKPNALKAIGFSWFFRTRFYLKFWFALFINPPAAYNLWQALRLAKTKQAHVIGMDKGECFVPLGTWGFYMWLIASISEWTGKTIVPGATLNVLWILLAVFCAMAAVKDLKGKIVIGVIFGIFGILVALITLHVTGTWNVLLAINHFFEWFGFPKDFVRSYALFVSFVMAIYVIHGIAWGRVARAMDFDGNNILPDRLHREISYPWESHRLGTEISDFIEWVFCDSSDIGIVSIMDGGDNKSDKDMESFALYVLKDVPGGKTIAAVARRVNTSQGVEVRKPTPSET